LFRQKNYGQKRTTNVANKQNKGKFTPTTEHEDPEGEYRYNSTLSLISALDGVGS